jgi:hypothetical protein
MTLDEEEAKPSSSILLTTAKRLLVGWRALDISHPLSGRPVAERQVYQKRIRYSLLHRSSIAVDSWRQIVPAVIVVASPRSGSDACATAMPTSEVQSRGGD